MCGHIGLPNTYLKLGASTHCCEQREQMLDTCPWAGCFLQRGQRTRIRVTVGTRTSSKRCGTRQAFLVPSLKFTQPANPCSSHEEERESPSPHVESERQRNVGAPIIPDGV